MFPQECHTCLIVDCTGSPTLTRTDGTQETCVRGVLLEVRRPDGCLEPCNDGILGSEDWRGCVRQIDIVGTTLEGNQMEWIGSELSVQEMQDEERSEWAVVEALKFFKDKFHFAMLEKEREKVLDRIKELGWTEEVTLPWPEGWSVCSDGEVPFEDERCLVSTLEESRAGMLSRPHWGNCRWCFRAVQLHTQCPCGHGELRDITPPHSVHLNVRLFHTHPTHKGHPNKGRQVHNPLFTGKHGERWAHQHAGL